MTVLSVFGVRAMLRGAVVMMLAALLSGCETPPGLGKGGRSLEERVAPVGTDRTPAAARSSGAVVPTPVDGAAEGAAGRTVEPQIFPGTGRFVQPPGRSPRAVTAVEGNITLNFVKTDIQEVVRTILGETLQLNYTIDPSVKGAVTFRTRAPVPRESLLPTLETLLANSGFGLELDNGVYRVLSLESDGQFRLPRRSAGPGSDDSGYATEIIPLVYVSVAEMQKIIQPLLGAQTKLSIDQARNLLIVTGPAPQRRALQETVEMFDVDWMRGMSFALLPITSADPTSLIEELEAIFGLDRSGPLTGQIRFVPIERLSAVLAIARNPRDLEEARSWIGRLDRGLVENGRRLYVYYAQHTRVDEMAKVLQDIFQDNSRRRSSSGVAGRSRPGDLAEGLEPARIGTPRREQPEARESRGAPDTFGDSAADPARDSRGGAASRRGGLSRNAENASGVRITTDEINNALFILATPRDYRLVEAAIRNLDIVPLQVLIEATIAEVTLTDELRYGVQWFFQDGKNSVALSAADAALPGQQFPGFSYLFSGTNARVVLNALASVTDVNVISSPQLMVLDNRSATLQVGDQVPVVTQSAVGVANPGAPIVNQIEFRDTGVILTVLPRVNFSGTVTMEIQQEVSDVVPTTSSGIDSPTIRQRKVESTVSIQSGQTIALGGLIRDGLSSVQSGVPVLKDIPVLGNLFKSTDNRKERTELLVLITPRVIRSDDEARHITEQLRRRLRAVEPLGDRID